MPPVRMAWLRLPLFLLQALPYLSYRWVTDESWHAGPAYSIAQSNRIANPAFDPNELENQFDTRPPGTEIVIAAAFRLFGPSQTAARCGSILAGLMIIFSLIVLRAMLSGKRARRSLHFLSQPIT